MGSPMGQLSAWPAPKRWAVAGPKAFMTHAWALLACPKELWTAFSMVLRGAVACSMSILASSKNRAHSWPTCFSVG